MAFADWRFKAAKSQNHLSSEGMATIKYSVSICMVYVSITFLGSNH